MWYLNYALKDKDAHFQSFPLNLSPRPFLDFARVNWLISDFSNFSPFFRLVWLRLCQSCLSVQLCFIISMCCSFSLYFIYLCPNLYYFLPFTVFLKTCATPLVYLRPLFLKRCGFLFFFCFLCIWVFCLSVYKYTTCMPLLTGQKRTEWVWTIGVGQKRSEGT